MALDAAFTLELARLCQHLEDPDTHADALATVLSTAPGPTMQPPVIDVKGELEGAWELDQAALLEARSAVLDEVGLPTALPTASYLTPCGRPSQPSPKLCSPRSRRCMTISPQRMRACTRRTPSSGRCVEKYTTSSRIFGPRRHHEGLRTLLGKPKMPSSKPD